VLLLLLLLLLLGWQHRWRSPPFKACPGRDAWLLLLLLWCLHWLR
jgi:hypothetical protein